MVYIICEEPPAIIREETEEERKAKWKKELDCMFWSNIHEYSRDTHVRLFLECVWAGKEKVWFPKRFREKCGECHNGDDHSILPQAGNKP